MKKTIIWIIILALVIWGITSLGGEKGEGEVIRIGAPTSLTGVAAAFGEMAQKGMELAVKDINEAGGVDGRMVELYIEDDKTSPKDAVTAYRKLVDIDKVDGLIGSQFDFVTQPLLPLALQDEMILISPPNFEIEGAFDMNEYTFVMYPKFKDVVSVLKDALADQDIEQMGMVRFQSEFSGEIERALESILEELNEEPIITEVYAEIGNIDFGTHILKLKEQGVNVVFLDMLDSDLLAFMQRAKELNFNPVVVSYTTVRAALASAGEDASLFEGLIMLDWEVSSDAFEKHFEKEYGIKPIKSANKAYDAVFVLAEAIVRGDGLPEYVEETEFSTLNSTFSFTRNHATQDTPVNVYQIQKGEFVLLGSY